ncbi:TPA_asm: tail completion or Neck1 protein [Caudoviricetes sp. vir524]|jgi:HK97 gp10 family phage protein|nr:TPA_asm: tail completion or Neck1 protein [Caudoviricetes sp. vir524]
MQATVRIKGMAELTRRLRGVKTAIGDTLEEAGTKGMLVVEGGARSNVSVDIGELRRGITTKTLEKTENSVKIGTGTNVEYAPYLEYGTGIYAENGKGRTTPWVYYYAGTKGPEGWRFTRGNKAKPFLRPAYDENKEKVQEVVRGELERAIEGAL